MAAQAVQVSLFSLLEEARPPMLRASTVAVVVGDLVEVPGEARRWGEVVSVGSRFAVIQWRERCPGGFDRRTTAVDLCRLVIMQKRGQR